MKIFKSLFKKYQAYKDRKFKERLERVLESNAINSCLVVKGKIVANNIYCHVPNETIEKFENGTPINDLL